MSATNRASNWPTVSELDVTSPTTSVPSWPPRLDLDAGSGHRQPIMPLEVHADDGRCALPDVRHDDAPVSVMLRVSGFAEKQSLPVTRTPTQWLPAPRTPAQWPTREAVCRWRSATMPRASQSPRSLWPEPRRTARRPAHRARRSRWLPAPSRWQGRCRTPTGAEGSNAARRRERRRFRGRYRPCCRRRRTERSLSP